MGCSVPMKEIRCFILLCLIAYSVIAQTRHLRTEEEYDAETTKRNKATKRSRKVSLSSSTAHSSLYSLSSFFSLLSRTIENVDPKDVAGADVLQAGKGDESEQDVGDYLHPTIKTKRGHEESQETRKLMHHFGIFKAYDKSPDDSRPPQYAKVSRRHAIEEYLSPMQKMMKRKRESSSISRDEAFDGSWTGFDKIKH